MRTQRPCTAQNKHRAEKPGSDMRWQEQVCCYCYLQLVSPSLPHSSHQVKHLEPYKGIFRLWWGVNSLCGQRGEGSHTPALPGPTISRGVEYWVAAGVRNLAVNETPFPDDAESHQSLGAANVQPLCSPHTGAERCLLGGTAAGSNHGIPRSAPGLEPITAAGLSFYCMKLYCLVCKDINFFSWIFFYHR